MSTEKSEGLKFNDALNKKEAEEKAKEYEISTTRDQNNPNKPSEKGGSKRRSTKKDAEL